MDTTALLNAIHALGMAAIPFVVAWVGKHVKSAQLQKVIDDAVGRAGGIAYHYLTALATGQSASAARSAAISAGVDYLNRMVPDALDALGVQTGALRDMVTGELGKLLAADPTVTPNVQNPPAKSPLAAPLPPPAPQTPPA